MGFSGMLLPEADPSERERDTCLLKWTDYPTQLHDVCVCVSLHLSKAAGSSGRRRDSLGHRLVVLLPRVPWPSELPSSFDAASQL